MIYLLLSNVITIIAFILGVNIGIKLRKNEKIEIIPNIPKIINEHAKAVEQEKALNEFAMIDRNLANYKGTAEGQVDIK